MLVRNKDTQEAGLSYLDIFSYCSLLKYKVIPQIESCVSTEYLPPP